MASDAMVPLQAADTEAGGAALQHRPWRSRGGLSSALETLERFLGRAGFDRAPWVAVAFAAGIGAWFLLPRQEMWLALVAGCAGMALVALAGMRVDGRFPYLRQALWVLPVTVAAGCVIVWTKSELVGAAPISGPTVAALEGTVIERDERPADGRVRLTLATREPGSARAIRVRINVPLDSVGANAPEGSVVRLRARLMPPAPPLLPGGYDFARAAWFSGLSATGSALGPVTIVHPGEPGGVWSRAQDRLSEHVRSRLDGTPGALAAAFASGDRGAIAEDDDRAMRDAGLAHLLSISGLHVSAVIAATYFLAIRLFALWPWLALRVRLPILAAGAGALAGVGYTLLTGAEVPTVRSCVGAILVLLALALGREPLSLRLLAIAALVVLLLWPEAVVGPSFQMSFASVIAIVALHNAAPMRALTAPREDPWWQRGSRQLAMLLLTGVVIEFALMPIGLYHFHRAGVYGAFANVIAIPLTTMVSMPLIALALFLDVVGAGAPAWWMAGKSLELLVALAHWTAGLPGSVTVLPAMGRGSIALFVAGGLWLALWRGRARLLGLLPVATGALSLALLEPPDLLVSGDGRHVGITTPAGGLVMLREGGGFAGERMVELAGMDGTPTLIEDLPGARCNADFCAVDIVRHGRTWRLLFSRGRVSVPERSLAAACERADIVIADRWLPRSCRPAWLKADRSLLSRTGGLAIDLERRSVTSVADTQGEHGWWREPQPRKLRPAIARPTAAPSAGPKPQL